MGTTLALPSRSLLDSRRSKIPLLESETIRFEMTSFYLDDKTQVSIPTTLVFSVNLTSTEMKMVDQCLSIKVDFKENYVELESLAHKANDVRLCPAHGALFADRMLQMVLDVALRMNMSRIELTDASAFPESTFPNIPHQIRVYGMTRVLLLTRGFSMYNRRGYLSLIAGRMNCETDVKLANNVLEQVFICRCSPIFYQLFLFFIHHMYEIEIKREEFTEVFLTMTIPCIKISQEEFDEHGSKNIDRMKIGENKILLSQLVEYFAVASSELKYTCVETSTGVYCISHDNIWSLLIPRVFDVRRSMNKRTAQQNITQLHKFKSLKSAARFFWNKFMSTSIEKESQYDNTVLFETFLNLMPKTERRCVKYLKDSNDRDVDIVFEINECKTNKPGRFMIVPKKRKNERNEYTQPLKK